MFKSLTRELLGELKKTVGKQSTRKAKEAAA